MKLDHFEKFDDLCTAGKPSYQSFSIHRGMHSRWAILVATPSNHNDNVEIYVEANTIPEAIDAAIEKFKRFNKG